jgi:hypothetical protein
VILVAAPLQIPMDLRLRMRRNGTGLCDGIATAYKCNGLATTGRQQDPTASCPDPVALARRTSLGNNIGAPFVSSGFRARPFRRKRRSPKHRSHRGIATMDTMGHIAAYLAGQRPA